MSNNSTVWVLDLDDTLYSERDYQLSGYAFIARHIQSLYRLDVTEIIQKADREGTDVFQALCLALSLPDSVKQSLLWMYRLHVPYIQVTDQTQKVIDEIQSKCHSLAIITDGRSISQRNKLLALGLEKVETLVSEEWNEVKPGERRFREIEKRYPEAHKFVYVGDNIKKDFITPNSRGWMTIGVRDNGLNIHSQDVSTVEASYLPHYWVNSFSDIQDYLC